MKICYVTGTRAEYGLLEPLMKLTSEDETIVNQIIVTGSHLSPEFGYTKKEIDFLLFDVVEEAEILLSSDSRVGICKAMGLAMISVGEILNRIVPDLLVLLGDRFEMLSFASSALVHRIPVAHLHGGEITEGAIDDSIRHAVTKLSHLHFTSTDEYRRRVIQLGECTDNVFNVGAIGLDRINQMQLLSRIDLQIDLHIKFRAKNILITYHPVTLEEIPIEDQLENLFDACDSFNNDFMFIFTKANADDQGRFVNKKIEEYVGEHSDNSTVYDSLGSLKYLSLMKEVDLVIGNSSSGIIEAPSLSIPVINIGSRQKGRIHADTVIDTGYDTSEVIEAMKLALSDEYVKKCQTVYNPYGRGDTAKRIYNVISNCDFKSLLRKRFYDN